MICYFLTRKNGNDSVGMTEPVAVCMGGKRTLSSSENKRILSSIFSRVTCCVTSVICKLSV